MRYCLSIAFVYFGYDESDIINANFAYRSTWVDNQQDKNWWYKESKDSTAINDVWVCSVSHYDYMHRFNIEHTENAEKLTTQTKTIISQMISFAEAVIREFNEYQNGIVDEPEYIEKCKPLFEEISKLYFTETSLAIPPVKLHEWSQKCNNIASTIHDFTIFYGDAFMADRTAENRIQCMRMAIKRYYEDLQALGQGNQDHIIGLPIH